MGDANKKIAVAGIVSILLVAAVVGVAVTVSKKNGGSKDNGGSHDIATSNKAVGAICSTADNQELCKKSLANANSEDPKTLIQTALNATIDSVTAVMKNSSLLKEAATDKNTKDAYDVCSEALDRVVDDLRRTVDQIGVFDTSKAEEIVMDLRTWMSAVLTFEETCTDAFDNTTGDNGEKMRELLKEAKELSANGLNMVSGLSSILSKLGIARLNISESDSSRNLLWAERRLAVAFRPNVVVALDGTGQFKSINQAIAMVPEMNARPFVIFVKAGLYREYVDIPRKKNHIVLIGEGPERTRITGNRNNVAGVRTFASATLTVNAEDFTAKNIAIENTAGPQGGQAVALRVSNDRALFQNVNLDGFQDTLYTHTYRQFYRFCRISGTVDFVFGDALAIFQKCTFVVRKPMPGQACMVTAQGRMKRESIGGIIIQGGNIVAEKAFLDSIPPFKAYLGRPWKELARTIIMYCDIGAFIAPEGWSPWNGNFALNTLYYAEYRNRGPGSNPVGRVKWAGIKHLTDQDAQFWTAERQFFPDQWVRFSGIPYWPNFATIL